MKSQDYSRTGALSDEPGPDVEALLGGPLRRWGRMDPLSRLAILAVGALLRQEGAVEGTVGLIAGTRHGSLSTDLAFAETLRDGPGFASPLLFSYTLANVPLAEAASQWNLKGPVYALFAGAPNDTAVREARDWFSTPNPPDAMIAGIIDLPPDGPPVADFQLLRREAP